MPKEMAWRSLSVFLLLSQAGCLADAESSTKAPDSDEDSLSTSVAGTGSSGVQLDRSKKVNQLAEQERCETSKQGNFDQYTGLTRQERCTGEAIEAGHRGLSRPGGVHRGRP